MNLNVWMCYKAKKLVFLDHYVLIDAGHVAVEAVKTGSSQRFYT